MPKFLQSTSHVAVVRRCFKHLPHRLAKASAFTQQYEQNLQKIGGFDTLESFWSYYSHLKRPSQLDAFSSYHVFRDETTPTWENYSQGGHWLVTMKKPVGQDDRLNRLWEQLLYALIGEEFEDPLVVGIVVQVRSKEDVLSVWLSDKAPKFRVGEKLKQILHLGPSTVIEYKNNASSIKDGTGIRNAQAYKIAEEKKKKQPEKTEKT
jgi:translation initiation factor 4E